MAHPQISTEKPLADDTVFIAPTATVIGEVTLGKHASVWYGASVRADLAPITIGEGSNVQDNASIHVDVDVPATIGNYVTIGHNAVVHGATIEDEALIGMGAVVLNNVVVGAGSLIAAGSVIRAGTVIPPNSMVAGVPAKVVKELTPEQRAHLRENAELYVACAAEHRQAAQGAQRG
jgi:carbonic anhydrase/acetyltransferase-like protein (isoleucine patch superfamily)